MKKLKSFISIICIVALLLCGTVNAFAVPANECSYKQTFDNKTYAPPVEKATIDDSCLYYAILSTAGSYAKKYYNASDNEANFSEESLREIAGNPDINNFGDTLYKSIGCNIGNNYSITAVEFLTGRGTRYLKEKIAENGAIVAAIAIPAEDGLYNTKYYNNEKDNFVYPGGENDKYHAISIVGWDDTYDCNSFNKGICTENGAWLCKNSYGTDFGDGGYFYISYTTPLVYSAALEVSQSNGICLKLNANRIVKHLGFISGVNVRAYSSATEEITVKVGEKVAFQGEVQLKNGCNLITFDRPVLSGTVSIDGKNISTSPDTVYCYVSLFKKNCLNVKAPDADENWVQDVERISVSIENDCKCTSDNPEVEHTMTKNSTDNCYYIVPADGYKFTQNTVIKKINGFDDNNLMMIYGNAYQKFKQNSTIAAAVSADYKRLLAGDGKTFIKMIEFDEDYDGGRGRLKIVSKNVGSAYVKEVNLLTDEKGEIKNTILTFDDGSVLPVSSKITKYKDAERTEVINEIDDLSEYFADIKISEYYAQDLTVKINGVTQYSIKPEDEKIAISVKLTVPDIEQTILESIETIRVFLAQILGRFRFFGTN